MLRLRELVAYAMDLSSFFCPIRPTCHRVVLGTN